jgi:hypothetical protein
MFQVVFGVTADEVEVVDWLIGWLVHSKNDILC